MEAGRWGWGRALALACGVWCAAACAGSSPGDDAGASAGGRDLGAELAPTRWEMPGGVPRRPPTPEAVDAAVPVDLGLRCPEGLDPARCGDRSWYGSFVPDDVPGAAPVDAAVDDASAPIATALPLVVSFATDSSDGPRGPEVPSAVDPRGTVYLALDRPAGARRVTGGADLDRTLVIGFDAMNRRTVVLPATGGLHVLPHGLAADDDGFYVLATYDDEVVLPGARWPHTAASGSCVIAFDRTGTVRWHVELGATSWNAGSRLSARRPDRLTVVGIANDSRSRPQVVRIELSRAGERLALYDLGAATGSLFEGDVSPRGDVVTMVSVGFTSDGDPASVFSMWEPDGSLRWALSSPWAIPVLDDLGRPYLASPRICTGSKWSHQEMMCVAAFDGLARRRWLVGGPTLFGQDVYATRVRSAAWSGNRVAFAMEYAAGYTDYCGHCIPQWSRTEGIRVDVDGHFGRALGGLGAVAGGGRACDASPAPSFGCGTWEAPRNRRELVSCTGAAARPCPDGAVPCGGVCVDLEHAADHCGACGRSCADSFPHQGAVCSEGACVARACEHGHANCDGVAANGCEADLADSTAHCGGCGRSCGAGAVCRGGLCCVGAACEATPFASDGHEGAFAPRRDVVLSPGVHHFTTIDVPAGVTVGTEPSGTLELRATGGVYIAGTLTVSGTSPGRRCDGDDAGALPRAPAGPAPGQDGYERTYSSAGCGPCGAPTARLPVDFDALYQSPPGDPIRSNIIGPQCHGNCAYSGCVTLGSHPTTGSIGPEAAEDLAVHRYFGPGSAGGSFRRPTGQDFDFPSCTDAGGGGGGALRLASPLRVVVVGTGRLLADGSGGVVNGAGSGGVVVVHAPEVRIATGASVSAGSAAPGGLGRVRVAADPARCTLSGTFVPPLVDGCRPTSADEARGHTFVGPWPM